MTAELEFVPSRLGSVRGVRVLSVGSYAPDQVVTNADLKSKLDCDPDWIVQRTGIRERRHAPPGMATGDLAVRAARQCIERADIQAADIDLVLVATFTPDKTCPATACLVQHELGLRAPAFDLQAACAGFMYALVTGMQFVKAGGSRLALVIGADCNSRVADPHDKKSFPLFGDGAGAVLLAPGDQRQGLISYTLGADGGGTELLHAPAGGSRLPITAELLAAGQHYLLMEGRAVFKWAVRIVERTTRDVLAHAGKTLADVDLAILHQANARILDAAAANLGLDPTKVLSNLDRYGNTSAASIPLVLDEALRAGRVRRGDLLLLSGFGAGLTWGTGLLAW